MIILAIGAGGSFSIVHAQTETSTQTTLSGDLENNPVAQDILRKIELTKQWIADLEQKNYEKLQAQQFLEEKRAIALERLNQDLVEWDELWSEYSSRNAFERFVADKPEAVQGVFWDAFEFREMKVQAGRDALKSVLANGGTMKEAREAYLKAAETKRIELIEANAQFNVKHNLAYYKQQVLFDIEGKFVNTTETRAKLNEYYQDYRENPAYMAANPDDTLSYEEMVTTNANTQCREGYVVVHRLHANDYVCVTEAAAEMWVFHGVGVIPSVQLSAYPDSERYGTSSYILEQLRKKDLDTIVYDINEKFTIIGDEAEKKKLELVKRYDQLYEAEKTKATSEEKVAIKQFYLTEMTERDLSDLILVVRDKYKDSMETILDQKMQSLDELKKEQDMVAMDIMKENEQYPEIKISWNSGLLRYEAVLKTAS